MLAAHAASQTYLCHVIVIALSGLLVSLDSVERSKLHTARGKVCAKRNAGMIEVVHHERKSRPAAGRQPGVYLLQLVV